ALLNLTRSVAVEVGRKGDHIRVNCVLPGGTRTAMTEALYDNAYWADRQNFRDVPLRDYCRPDDIADAIVHLASDEAAFMTAAALVVDGGWMLSNRI
ncbi:MAG: SDR family NAD(P)-dependent oxidoreductase, partial [Thermaurantiacus sp.]